MTNEQLAQRAREADETYDLLTHVGWTDVVKPKLLKDKSIQEKILVDHLLGRPLPDGQTKEQVAGRIYGINYIIETLESILRTGMKCGELLKDNIPGLM